MMSKWIVVLCACLVIAVTVGFAANLNQAADQSSTRLVATPIDSCPLPVVLADPFPEQQGISTNAELWALFFPKHTLPVYSGEEIKIAWHMTGKGSLRMKAVHPDGTEVLPSWGPEPHDGSNWERPGDEWGTGFVFPKPGCWKVIASRDNASGELLIKVVPQPNPDYFWQWVKSLGELFMRLFNAFL